MEQRRKAQKGREKMRTMREAKRKQKIKERN